MSINREMDKEDVVHIHKGIEKKEMMPFAATWIDVEIVTLSEVVIQRKEKYYARSLICGS